MKIQAQRKQGLAERMATVLGVPSERVRIIITPGEAVQIDIGDMKRDGTFLVAADVPPAQQAAAGALARKMLEEER